MDREQRIGLMVLVVAMVTIVAMIWPLSSMSVLDGDGTEVLDESLER